MNQDDIHRLDHLYGIQTPENQLQVLSGDGGMPVIEVQNSLASASISLQGAHLLSWVPRGELDVLWLSEDARFAQGKPIRGGIPVCWPWFSDHQSRKDFPAHGFARTSPWQIDSTQALHDGSTRINFSLHPQANNEHMWIAQTTLTYTVTIGATLQLELVTHNQGDKIVTISQALHTYFQVARVDNVLLQGLDQAFYLDKLNSFNKKQQHGPVIIDQEVDRIYLDTISDCIIEDKQLGRNIIIRKHGSRSTVVWNPGKQTAHRMGDLGENGYQQMLCVESSNAASDVVDIGPGKRHRLSVVYELQGNPGEKLQPYQPESTE